MSGILKHILRELGFQPIAEMRVPSKRGVSICRIDKKVTPLWVFESTDPHYDIQLCGNTKFALAEPNSLKRIKDAVHYCSENKERRGGCLECPYRLDKGGIYHKKTESGSP